MKNIFHKLNQALKLIGINIPMLFNFFITLPIFVIDYRKFKKQIRNNNEFNTIRLCPIQNEKNKQSGTMSGQYFHQDLLIARKVFKNNPKKHIDIGSSTSGFVAHVASFRNLEIFDIRAQKSKVKGINFKQADLMQLPKKLTNYCDSISSLHAIEHFGLGRYGDPIDSEGHKKAIANIHKILQKGGVFYFSVPIGPQRIEFNAHRVFDISYLLKILEKDFTLKSFSYVDDNGNLHENIRLNNKKIASNYGCYNGCGIFELIKTENGEFFSRKFNQSHYS